MPRPCGRGRSTYSSNSRIARTRAGEVRAPAAEHYAAAVALRPDFDRAFNNLGVMMMKLGETDRAIHYFEEAVRVRPDYDEARANLERAQKARIEQPATP